MHKKIKEILLKVGLILVVLLFITTLLTKRFLYFRPSSVMLPVEETYRVIRQGHLHGWLAEGSPESKVVLICPSHKGNVSHSVSTIKNLQNLGYSVLAFDYSGFGKSDGIPGEQQIYEDASYMVALLRQTYHPNQIVIYGKGLGASVATYVARRYDIPTLILISPFPSARTIVSRTPLKFIASLFSEFKTLEYLSGYRGKSLSIHSTQDDFVPYETTLEIHRQVTRHIQTTGTHDKTIIPWDSVKRFIEENANNK